MDHIIGVETACRACRLENLRKILSLGSTPLADRLVSQDHLNQKDREVPLTLQFCPDCSLVQIAETVKPEELFCNGYPYYSSVSPFLSEHFRRSACHLMEVLKLDSTSLVMEAASNDGYLLRHFHERGIPVLGIDPAEGPVSAAEKQGITTLQDFFTFELAERLHRAGESADLFLANNVLAHVADLNGFVEGIHLLLKNHGTLVIEVPYLKDLVEKLEFDTIYHQHLCYFSVTALDNLFRSHGLFLNDVWRLPVHGGSLRLFVRKVEDVQASVTQLLDQEETEGLCGFGYYRQFAERVEHFRKSLRNLVLKLRSEGKRLAAYGAAAKGTTLLSYAGLSREEIDFVVDLNPHKHGRYLPGARIPIVSPERLCIERPDYVLLLAWNFAEEVIQQQQPYLEAGGKFILPIPEPHIVGGVGNP